MRVAVNTRLLIKNKMDGIGRFTFETLKRITKRNPEVEFHFIFDRKFSSEFLFSDNIIPHILSPATRHPILWYVWFELKLPKLIKKINPHLFFSPDGFISTKLSVPTITTIHDINFEHRPEDLAWSHSFFYRYFFKKYAQLSNQIITVSNFSKKDIIKKYEIDEDKITVIYNGVSNDFCKISELKRVEIKNKYSQGEDFFIFIGSLHKRKNINTLLLVFDSYRKNGGKTKLMIIGQKKWMDSKTNTTYQEMKFKKEVIFLGQITQRELIPILGSAKGLFFISLFEGFGLPIIEAMKSGIPVITSNTSAMPEIADNAALIVNPYNTTEIMHAISKLDGDESLRLELINKGYERVKLFDWEITADKIWQLIKSTANI